MIGPALLSAATALVGAWVGAALGLRRFKRERSWERVAKWFEDMIGAILQAQFALDGVLDAIDAGDEPGARQAALTAERKSAVLKECARLSVLYGSRRVNKLIKAYAGGVDEVSPSPTASPLDSFREVSLAHRVGLSELSLAIANEAREHLELEPLLHFPQLSFEAGIVAAGEADSVTDQTSQP